MYYRVERTYLTNASGVSEQTSDQRPYLVSGRTSAEAAIAFLEQERARLLGSVSTLAGDKALATATGEGRLFVVFVQRGVEAVASGLDDTARKRARSGETRDERDLRR
jgi:hypothetical protein